MAPRVGIEPTTNWLTANCTTAVLSRNKLWRSQGVTIPLLRRDKPVCVHEHLGTKFGGGGRNRTYVVSYVGDLQSLAFAAQHTPPYFVTLSAMLLDSVRG